MANKLIPEINLFFKKSFITSQRGIPLMFYLQYGIIEAVPEKGIAEIWKE